VLFDKTHYDVENGSWCCLMDVARRTGITDDRDTTTTTAPLTDRMTTSWKSSLAQLEGAARKRDLTTLRVEHSSL